MSEQADAVVVGGGIQGVAAALQLAEAGLKDVRLLERDELFSGTSSAGAGFVAEWAAISPYGYGDEELAVEQYGISYYRQLHDRGYDIDFAQNGLLILAASEDAWQRLLAPVRRRADPGTRLVTAAEIETITDRALSTAGLLGGIFQPAAVQVFTQKLGLALTAHLTDTGVTVESRRPVTELIVEHGRVVGVATSHGVVDSDTVIVAGGAWTNELLRPHGITLPYIPRVTSRIITGDLGVSSAMPMMMIAGAAADGPLLWMRHHDGGLLWGGVYGNYPRDMFVEEQQLPSRLDEIPIDGILECRRVASLASRFIPFLEGHQKIRLRHGVPCYTPDHRALVGPVPGIDGLYVIAGDNEAGLTHGPGFAKALVDAIVGNASDLVDLRAWRVDRFQNQYQSAADIAAAVSASMAPAEGVVVDSTT